MPVIERALDVAFCLAFALLALTPELGLVLVYAR